MKKITEKKRLEVLATAKKFVEYTKTVSDRIAEGNENDLAEIENDLAGRAAAFVGMEIHDRRNELNAGRYTYSCWDEVFPCIEDAIELSGEFRDAIEYSETIKKNLEEETVFEMRTPANWIALRIANMHHEEYAEIRLLIADWLADHPLVETRESDYQDDLESDMEIEETERSLGKWW